MPFCTPLNCVEVLLAATGLRNEPNMQDLTISLLDLVYLQVRVHRCTLQAGYRCRVNKAGKCLQREKLYSHVQCLAQGHVAKTDQEKRNRMTLESNVLLLGASVVLCGTFFSCTDGEATKVVASKLSKLADVKTDDIWRMANILLVMAIQE